MMESVSHAKILNTVIILLKIICISVLIAQKGTSAMGLIKRNVARDIMEKMGYV